MESGSRCCGLFSILAPDGKIDADANKRPRLRLCGITKEHWTPAKVAAQQMDRRRRHLTLAGRDRGLRLDRVLGRVDLTPNAANKKRATDVHVR